MNDLSSTVLAKIDGKIMFLKFYLCSELTISSIARNSAQNIKAFFAILDRKLSTDSFRKGDNF